MADNRRKTANGTRTRYKHPPKTELGQERLPVDKGRNRKALYLAAKMLIDDEDRMSIVEEIMNKYGYSESMAGEIYLKASKNIEKRAERLAEKVAEKNHLRLEEIIEDAMDGNNYRTALQSIDIENKMVGAYIQKVDIKTNEPISISFD